MVRTVIREHQTISQVNQRAARVCGDIVRHGEKDLEISRALATEIVGHCMTFPGPVIVRYQIILRGRETVYGSEPRARRGSSQVKLTDCHGFLPSCYSNRRCGF